MGLRNKTHIWDSKNGTQNVGLEIGTQMWDSTSVRRRILARARALPRVTLKRESGIFEAQVLVKFRKNEEIDASMTHERKEASGA